MVYQFRPETARPGVAETISALLSSDGGKGHPYFSTRIFIRSRETGRDLADALHFITNLHGRSPGVLDLAAERPAPAAVRSWLDAAMQGFIEERNYLTRIVVAAGPLPSTPGQAESEAAASAQRHAVEMLARSDREGCALGAAMALLLDWRAIRAVVDAAAQRFGVALLPPALPSPRQTLALAGEAATAGVERAMVFGAHQLLLQHHGLWNMLEARAEARIGT